MKKLTEMHQNALKRTDSQYTLKDVCCTTNKWDIEADLPSSRSENTAPSPPLSYRALPFTLL